MENFHKNQPKSQEYHIYFGKYFYLTAINIYLINNKTNHFLEKYILDRKKSKKTSWYFLHFRSDVEQDPDTDPDPLFNETDLRIMIRIKMKRIRNNWILPTFYYLNCLEIYQMRKEKWTFGEENQDYKVAGKISRQLI